MADATSSFCWNADMGTRDAAPNERSNASLLSSKTNFDLRLKFLKSGGIGHGPADSVIESAICGLFVYEKSQA
jgi:hypothetical protein